MGEYHPMHLSVPRKLATAPIHPERKYALVWLLSIAGMDGETPPLSIASFERHVGWTRKAARIFVDYALSVRCASETGVSVALGTSEPSGARSFVVSLTDASG